MATRHTKERLLEVMQKVNPEFKLNEEDEFFPITTPVGSEDDRMFIKVVNQGIDSHLEGFTKSKFDVQDQTLGKRRILNFHKSELPILIRRLRELGTDEAEQWANDIENYDENVSEMVNEGNSGFERKIGFWIYSKDGDFLGETDPMPEEAEWYGTKDEVLSSPEGQKFLADKNLTPEQIGAMKRERLYYMNGNPLSFEYYSPSQSQELFDDKTNTWYNRSGQQMRDPSEYERYSDGTNQWGERYDDDYEE